MAVTISSLLVLATLASSIVAMVQHKERLFPALALAASGIEALQVFGVLHVWVKAVPLAVLLGGLLLVSGCVIWARTSGSKLVASGATFISLTGAVQLLLALRVVHLA